MEIIRHKVEQPAGFAEGETIGKALEDWTAANSGFETSRPRISLSNIFQEDNIIIGEYFKGFNDTHEGRLKCYKGYQMETDLLYRIKEVFQDKVQLRVEILDANGLIGGHPDFTFAGYPGDCKSVPLDAHLPEHGRLPRRVYWQLQAYMKYLYKPWAVAVYESRETGKIVDYWIRENKAVQLQITEKLKRIVNTITMSHGK
jgi:hypothetical protein